MSHPLWPWELEVAALISIVASQSTGQGSLAPSGEAGWHLDASNGPLGTQASTHVASAPSWEQVVQDSVPVLITVSTSHIRHPGKRRVGSELHLPGEQLSLCLNEYLMTP